MKKILFFGFIFSVLSIQAQNLSTTGKLIQGGVEDGEKLVKAYIKPLNKAIVFGLSGANYMLSGNGQKKFFFGLKSAIIKIPKEDLLYDVSKLGLESIEAKDPSKTLAPSVFGDSIRTIRLASKKHDLFGRPLYEFDAPTGKQSDWMPLPYLTAGYRMSSTALTLNFIPYLRIPTTEMNIAMIGISVQQDASGLITALKEKNYGFSVQAGSSFLYGHEKLSVEPGGVYIPVSVSGSQTGPYDNQKINIFYTSYSLNIYGHYTLNNKYSFFSGIGITSGTAKIDVLGRYPVYGEDPSNSFAVVADDVDDPISIKENYIQTVFDIGFQAEWNKIILQAKYNLAEYGGLGINLAYKL